MFYYNYSLPNTEKNSVTKAICMSLSAPLPNRHAAGENSQGLCDLKGALVA